MVHIPKGTNITQEQKLKIAKEFNLSETVFLHESSEESIARQYDIFTKVAEIPFAGMSIYFSMLFDLLRSVITSI